MESFRWNSFHEFLIERGIADASEKIIEEARKEYRRLYQRYYRAISKKHQMNMLLSDTDFKHLKEKAKKFSLKKPTQYLLHLIRGDREEKYTAPNVLIDIEVGILRSIDGLAKMMNAKPETRATLLEVYRQLEELLLILAK